MASWQKGNLTKWHVDNMACWQNGMLTKWHFDKMVSWQNGKVDTIATWLKDNFAKRWHNSKSTNVELTKWQVDTMAKW
jgi:hypothetical protein